MRHLLSCAILCLLTLFAAQSDEGLRTPRLRAQELRAQADELRDSFRAAPLILPGESLPLKGLPLWHTNGPITSELIHEMFVRGKENGFGGMTFLPLSKTEPAHLTPEYLAKFGEVLDTAKENGMKVIFYDDVDFPSGAGGGHMSSRFPEDTLKRLDKYEWDVTGPCEFSESCPVELTDKAVVGQASGVLQGAVALNRTTYERINLTDAVQNGTLKWHVPDGDWKIMMFVCVADGRNLVDYMNPDSVRNVMSLTYDAVYERFKEHFGTTIPMVFFDDITNTQTEGSRNWTLGFGQKYRELYDRDPVLDYPALFYPIGPETPSTRYRLWTTRNELFADGYPKVVHQWCRERGVLSSGHPQGPYVIESIDMAGDAMLTHRSSDAVLFDSIHYYGHGRDGFKIPTSAAFNFDHDVCVVEIYGNYRDNTFDDSMMYRSAMEIFARGGNMLLPHGIWSDPDTVYIPPEISWRNPKLNGCLPAWGEYTSRCSLLLRGGRHVADFGMLYPIDAIKAFFHFQFDFVKKDYPYGILLPQETDYLAIGAELTHRLFHDFTLLHPNILDAKCESVQDEWGRTVLQLNNERNVERYPVVILTGADVIAWSNLQKILQFYEQGGSVLATTRLPSRSAEGSFDKEVQAAIQTMFGIDPTTQAPREAIRTGQEDITLPESFREARLINRQGEYVPTLENAIMYEEPIVAERAIFLPQPTTKALAQALEKLLPVPDVSITPAAGHELPMLNVTPRWDYPVDGMLQYIHKIKENRNIWFFANSSNRDAVCEIELRGHFRSLELWNPNTGEISPLTVKAGERNSVPVTQLSLTLPPITSLFIVETAE